MTITKRLFGKLPDKQDVIKYTLANENGIAVSIINYGGIVTSIITPNREGIFGDIVLGFDHIDGYISKEYKANCPYFGAIIGRFANRIAKGKFFINGIEYSLSINNGNNHLHGGNTGFDRVIWQVEELNKRDKQGLKLSYFSKDGEEGYPGNLLVSIFYMLTENNELMIEYTAETDWATPVALTNHSYFNLTAGKANNALGHIITINADKYLVIDEEFIPTGELRSVKGTPLNFKTPQTIGSRIEEVEGNGYAHTFVLNKKSDKPEWAAKVYSPISGREMEVYTTEPGLLLYSGNFLNGSLTGKKGEVYSQYYGIALETQHFPDSPNHPEFPSTILNPGEKFMSSTIYKFY